MKNAINSLVKLVTIKNIEWFVLFSPIMDLVTALMVRFSDIDATIGVLIRGVILLLILLYTIFITNSKYKKPIYVYLGLIVTYSLIFLSYCYFSKGLTYLFDELKILIKAFYFPMLLVGLFNLYQNKKEEIDDKILYKTANFYAILILIPSILSISFNSYGDYFKSGNVGLFYAANEIGAIITILFPIVLGILVKNFNSVFYYIITSVYIYVSLNIGTKVPLLGVVVTILAFVIISFINFLLNPDKKFIDYLKKPLIIPFLIIIVITGALIFTSDGSKNVKKHIDIVVEKEIADKSKVLDVIFSGRDSFNKTLWDRYQDSSVYEKVIGLGYNYLGKYGKATNNVEIDYLDTFYQFGILGFILVYLPLMFLIVPIFKKVISLKKLKMMVQDEKIPVYAISILLSLGIAFFAGHTLTSPSVSIFVVIILLNLYFKLNEVKKIR